MEFHKKIKEIREHFKLNQKEFADKTGITQAAVSRYEKNERTPDSNFLSTLINNLDINPMWLFLDQKPMVLEFNLYMTAYSLAEQNNKKDELKNLLLDFAEEQTTIKTIISKIEKIKGQTFFEKFTEGWSGKGTRMLRVLYFFLQYLKENKIEISSHIKQDFIEKLKSFEIPKSTKTKLMWSINSKDREKLITWANDELDDASIFEIMSSIDILIEEIQKQMNWFDYFVTKIDF